MDGLNGPRPDDEPPVDLRCSTIVIRGESVLLVRRTSPDDGVWVLPGGNPQLGETTASCARRETFEETGVRVSPTRCAFVAEVIDPENATRVVELIFLADLWSSSRDAELVGEPGRCPRWVPVDDLAGLRMLPPIAGYLPALIREARIRTRDVTATGAAYLGNVWRRPRDLQGTPGEGGE
jgi:ADP-ribose pyrophosphatase YjhB (NUDIX family)